MKATIKHQDLSEELFTSEQCFITELSNTAADPDISIARARVTPGVTTNWHRLNNTTERYYIVTGKARVDIGKLPPQVVNPSDIIIIPPMCRQRITNIGSGDLIFLAICSPRFTYTAYEDIEERKN